MLSQCLRMDCGNSDGLEMEASKPFTEQNLCGRAEHFGLPLHVLQQVFVWIFKSNSKAPAEAPKSTEIMNSYGVPTAY